jgi:hypothetical protein
MRDLRFPPPLKWILPSSGLLRGIRWFETDVSGPPIGPIFLGSLALEGGIDRKSRKVGFKPTYAA